MVTHTRHSSSAIGCLALLLLSLPVSAWDSGRLSVSLVIDELDIPYPEFAIYAMPGAPIAIALADPAVRAEYRFGDRAGLLGDASLAAPMEPGLEVLKITNLDNGESASINVFTMVPATEVEPDGRLNDYRIGKYPDEPLRDLKIYEPPPGFVEVTKGNRNIRVSPNFTLGQFVSKQDSGFPKYVVLRAVLLLKLERILAALNESGRPTRGFVIMSGYRTPFYNELIGNVTYSRHTWGGAADIFIDESPRDEQMDDLNRDGRIDREDAVWLASFIDDMSRRGEFETFEGGIGIYDHTAAHGPFVHVDTRGVIVRW